jgi:hypothetical protein
MQERQRAAVPLPSKKLVPRTTSVPPPRPPARASAEAEVEEYKADGDEAEEAEAEAEEDEDQEDEAEADGPALPSKPNDDGDGDREKNADGHEDNDDCEDDGGRDNNNNNGEHATSPKDKISGAQKDTPKQGQNAGLHADNPLTYLSGMRSTTASLASKSKADADVSVNVKPRKKRTRKTDIQVVQSDTARITNLQEISEDIRDPAELATDLFMVFAITEGAFPTEEGKRTLALKAWKLAWKEKKTEPRVKIPENVYSYVSVARRLSHLHLRRLIHSVDHPLPVHHSRPLPRRRSGYDGRSLWAAQPRWG